MGSFERPWEAAHAIVTNGCREQVLRWIQQPAKQVESIGPPVHTPALGFWQHISVLFLSILLLALAKGYKGAKPWSWQDVFFLLCGFFCFFPPSFPSGSLGNCAAFPVKSQPLPPDHTACYILTYFWSPLRTCFTMIPTLRAFILSFTHIWESMNDALPLCCLQQSSAPHIWLPSAPAFYAEEEKDKFKISWFCYLKLSHFSFKKQQAGWGGAALTPRSHCNALFFAGMWANQSLLRPQSVRSGYHIPACTDQRLQGGPLTALSVPPRWNQSSLKSATPKHQSRVVFFSVSLPDTNGRFGGEK